MYTYLKLLVKTIESGKKKGGPWYYFFTDNLTVTIQHSVKKILLLQKNSDCIL